MVGSASQLACSKHHSRDLIFAVFSCVFFAGCADDWVAEVNSNTSWSGAFGNSTVDGSGSRTVDLPDDEIVCCVVQKQSEHGSLSVSIKNQNNSIFASDDGKVVQRVLHTA